MTTPRIECIPNWPISVGGVIFMNREELANVVALLSIITAQANSVPLR